MTKLPFPNFESVSVSIPVNSGPSSALDNEELGVLLRLVNFVAHAGAHSMYSDRSEDPSIEDDDRVLSRIARIGINKWRTRMRDAMLTFFVTDGDRWRLTDWSYVRYTRESRRQSLTEQVKQVAFARAGGRCAYCGDSNGPFENDHLYPLSRGGTDDPNNIVLACVPCNRAKRDMTLQEWMEARLG